MLDHVGRKIVRHIQHAVVVVDLDAADKFGIDTAFVGDGADDVARLDAMLVAHFNAEGLHAWIGGAHHAFLFRETFAAVRTVAAVETLAAVCEVGTGRTFFPGRGLFFIQQQRHVAARHLGQCGGDFDRRHIVFAFVVLDQRLELFQLALCQRFADLRLELGDADVVDRLDGRQLQRADRLAGRTLDHLQQAALAWSDEKDRFAAAASAAGAADAVGVAFRIVRHIVVDHVADALHVQAARGHVGRY